MSDFLAAADAAIERTDADTLARLMPKPQPPGTGRETFVEHGLASYKQIKHSRFYSADLDFASAVGALAQAFCEAQRAKGKTFSREDLRREILEPLTTVDPELIQERPPPEKPLPAWPVDEASGLKIRNCYEKPYDLESQRQLEEKQPETAAWMKQIADNGGAPTFAMLAKRQAETEARERLRQLPYSEREHKGNVFSLSREDGALEKQSEFARANPDYVVRFYRREATVQPRLPFQGPRPNQTQLMKAHKLSPELGAVLTRAEQIYQEWNAADIARLKQLSATSLRKAEQLAGSLKKAEQLAAR